MGCKVTARGGRMEVQRGRQEPFPTSVGAVLQGLQKEQCLFLGLFRRLVPSHQLRPNPCQPKS